MSWFYLLSSNRKCRSFDALFKWGRWCYEDHNRGKMIQGSVMGSNQCMQANTFSPLEASEILKWIYSMHLSLFERSLAHDETLSMGWEIEQVFKRENRQNSTIFRRIWIFPWKHSWWQLRIHVLGLYWQLASSLVTDTYTAESHGIQDLESHTLYFIKGPSKAIKEIYVYLPYIERMALPRYVY